VRRATDADLPAILALEEQSFDPRDRWSAASWANELAADNRTVLVTGEPVAGVVSVQQVGAVAELNRIEVDPAYRRKDRGKALVSAAIEAAVAAQAEEMLLEVRHDNATALGLYARFGFTELARRAGYYAAGIDAVIMRLGLERRESQDND
jgi:[ribosomal protein S18]-alanine N-acetyltransferase